MRLGVMISLVGAMLGAGSTSTGHAAETRRPNILWLMAEDIGPDLGCYGDPDARTPNLDRLAGQGRMYRQAFSTAPLACYPWWRFEPHPDWTEPRWNSHPPVPLAQDWVLVRERAR